MRLNTCTIWIKTTRRKYSKCLQKVQKAENKSCLEKAEYAGEENLSAQDNSGESKDDSKRSNEAEINNSSTDFNKYALNFVRGSQKINNSFDFSTDIFRRDPIDFKYQRPQDGIIKHYPD